ncbi:hypothetical protein BGW37DRAFT_502590 [Umbelopsis sp. PMI_123]|nr:hypothetical protein BGW37DRAFT_502590 [Umbelopsis sp. PMI_123]
MGLKYRTYLNGTGIFCCKKCKTHLSSTDAIISRQFQGQHGQAYLIKYVVNIDHGDPEDRTMITGLHTVRDISCSKCKTIVGWTYVGVLCRFMCQNMIGKNQNSKLAISHFPFALHPDR